MALIKCPTCKNIVSNESYCCPRCGHGFAGMRFKRIVFWLVILVVAAWLAHHYWLYRYFPVGRYWLR
jgi:hypothetical protein